MTYKDYLEDIAPARIREECDDMQAELEECFGFTDLRLWSNPISRICTNWTENSILTVELDNDVSTGCKMPSIPERIREDYCGFSEVWNAAVPRLLDVWQCIGDYQRVRESILDNRARQNATRCEEALTLSEADVFNYVNACIEIAREEYLNMLVGVGEDMCELFDRLERSTISAICSVEEYESWCELGF